MTPPEVACLGDNCVDVAVDRDGEEQAGGNALNVAVELARAGRSVAYFGAVGDDARAAVILDAARAAGVDTSHTERRLGPTGVTIVRHDAEGERSFESEDYGVAAEYRLRDATAAAAAAHRWVHGARQPDLGIWAPTLKAHGAMLSYDFGDEPPIGALVAAVDVAFLSAPQAGAGELARAVLGQGCSLVVVTCGAGGSFALAAENRWRQPAAPVDPLLDTLGAGDAFIAGFLVARLHGSDVPGALERAAVAGAAACTRHGLASPILDPSTEVSTA